MSDVQNQLENPEERKASPVEMGVLVLLVVVFLIVSLWRQHPFAPGTDMRGAIGTIVAAGLTLVIYSFLYRDNPLFKVAENLYVGVALGYVAILSWRSSLRPEVYEPFFNAPTWGAFREAALHRSVPIILGVLLLMRLSKKYGWVSRYSYALMVGWGAGLSIPLTTHSYILLQLKSAVAPLQLGHGNAAMWTGDWFMTSVLPFVGATVVMIGTVSVLFYFFFSVDHKRTGRAFSRLGILFLMISFGASFGYTVMGRISLLIGRAEFLLFTWLNIHK